MTPDVLLLALDSLQLKLNAIQDQFEQIRAAADEMNSKSKLMAEPEPTPKGKVRWTKAMRNRKAAELRERWAAGDPTLAGGRTKPAVKQAWDAARRAKLSKAMKEVHRRKVAAKKATAKK